VIHRKLAGATGLEPAASSVTGRRSNLSEGVRANLSENWRAKDVLWRGDSGYPIDCVSEVGDGAAF
jgi:hypothetical protein